MGFMERLPRLRAASGELLHLDLMRFIASVGIVFHHSHEFFVPLAERAAQMERTAGLALFVDLFFIISGYVIAFVYHDRTGTFGDYATFIQRRIGRLVPLHWLTLAVAIAIWSLFRTVGAAGSHTPSFAPECIAETALLMHAYLPCGNGLTFNGVSWSISAEMVMYLAFPLVALLGARGGLLLLAAGVAALAALMTVNLSDYHWSLYGATWTEIPAVLRAAPSFAIGAALYYNRALIACVPAPRLILIGATLCSFVAMMNGAPELVTLVIVYIVAVAAIAADLQGAVSPAVRRCAPLGQLTYSIYMWHSIIILVLINAIGDKFLHGRQAATIFLAIVSYVAIGVVGYLSFFYIETPARRWVDRIDFSGWSRRNRGLAGAEAAARDETKNAQPQKAPAASSATLEERIHKSRAAGREASAD
ncbi:acyltransferase family protein [Methylocella silvestris]|nr:acyltransferase [Methylocella silvestris]